VPEDTLLVSPAAVPSIDYPNVVRAMSVRDYIVAGDCLRSASNAPRSGGRSVNFIKRTLDVQRPDSVTCTSVPFLATDSLPGDAPAVDHLYVRAREESCWKDLLPAIQLAREHRVPSSSSPHDTMEFVIGTASDHVIEFGMNRLRKYRAKVVEQFGFCRFAADTESVHIPRSAFEQLRDTRKPVTFERIDPWKSCEDRVSVPVRLMIGHMELALHIRMPFTETDDNGKIFLTISPITLQPELSELLDVIGTVVGVGIHKDLREFNDFLEVLSGERLKFAEPIDAAVVAHLAGFNLPRHGVANLVWTTLGGYLPKAVASVGDGLWYGVFLRLPEELQLYARGDTAQMALTYWVLVACWVFHMFPEFHVVASVTTATTVRELIVHWVDSFIDEYLTHIEKPAVWAPVTTRFEAVSLLLEGSPRKQLFLRLTPDWPAVTTGGCRFFHTARVWFADRLPGLIAADPDFWLRSYREEVVFLRLGRTLPPEPSPCRPVEDGVTRLSPNPGLIDILPVPASAVGKSALKSLRGPGRPKRAILLEYAVHSPQAAADLLVRIENSPRYASRLFCVDEKVAIFVHVLRKALRLLGAMPRRPRNWVDPYPDDDPVLRAQSTQKTAQQQADIALRKAHQHLSRHSQISGALVAARKEPATAVAPTDRLSRLVNVRAPGKARDEDRVIASLGCGPASRKRRRSGTRVFPARVPATPSTTTASVPVSSSPSSPPSNRSAIHSVASCRSRSPRVGSARFSARSPSPRYQPLRRVVSAQPCRPLSPSPAPSRSLSIMGGHTRIVRRVSPASSQRRQRSPSPLRPRRRVQSPPFRQRQQRPPSPIRPRRRVQSPLSRQRQQRSPSPLLPQRHDWSSPPPPLRRRVRSPTPPREQYRPASPIRPTRAERIAEALRKAARLVEIGAWN
jgi:hypothetical protein